VGFFQKKIYCCKLPVKRLAIKPGKERLTEGVSPDKSTTFRRNKLVFLNALGFAKGHNYLPARLNFLF